MPKYYFDEQHEHGVMGISLFPFDFNPTIIAKRVQMCCYFIRMNEPREMTDALKKPVNQDISEFVGF